MSYMIIYCSILMMFIKHPISMGITLLTQTILVSLSIGVFSLNFWFSYILLLIMIGGILIIFMYMTSIASNEKFKFNPFYLLVMPIMMIGMETKLNFNTNLIKFNENLNINITLSKFFNFPSNLIIIMIIIYLLITMIAVIKICKINKGPLRQMF
uniref:NADH-ubiquinone oxidoreductase chain 6 n=1 Tax=Cucujoidea sp. 40 KM-2017 TaxID=2219379 RepID=A0A346RHY1_9CUCU|nr:NADH dehydrogenase subunit 6 [Cucujoidea sp. 40 KM-2017]